MPELSGLDVYEGQRIIDWSLVPDLTFVCCKASEAREDGYFRRNWAAMRDRGFPCRSAYHFNTREPASVQANRFKGIVGDLGPGEFPSVDIEAIGLTARQARDLVDAVEFVFQRQALVYVGAFYPGVQQIVLDNPWWLPSYGISEERLRQQAFNALRMVPHVWQWGGGNEGADVPGVTPGARDDSNMVLRKAELIAWAGASTTNTEDTVTTPYFQRTSDNAPHLIYEDSGLRVNFATLDGSGEQQVASIIYLSGLNPDPTKRIVEKAKITDPNLDFLITRRFTEVASIQSVQALTKMVLDAIKSVPGTSVNVDPAAIAQAVIDAEKAQWAKP